MFMIVPHLKIPIAVASLIERAAEGVEMAII